MRNPIILSACLTLLMIGACKRKTEMLHESNEYKLYADRVEQQSFLAKAVSRTEITSSYQSPANQFIKPLIVFKFSINGKDNEMVPGVDHQIICSEKIHETPLIVFGKQFKDTTAIKGGVYLQPDTRLKIKLDMREVFSHFEQNGFYTTPTGAKIFKEDFKGVWVAGGTVPLSWDFDNLHNFEHLELKDVDGDHIFELELVLNEQRDKKESAPVWKLSADLAAYPQYESNNLLIDALYNMSLEEMMRAVEKDSTLRTGKEWAGVWTRDVSYSIILSMAVLQPKVAKYSLMRKVKDGMVIQDTGTGGAYPISTDRMIWAVAAWEIYKVTGERAWLEQVYPIIQKSLDYDLLNAIDPVTGLVKGESSFLDWREQTYPEWMQPADIFESQCLGTNAVHFQAHTVLAMMAKELNKDDVASKHLQVAESIKRAINQYLWMEDKGYYGQFLYGRNFKSLSPKSEALGEALCVLFGIADDARSKKIVERTPITPYGIPCIYPYIPNIPPYHNNGIWPFVQSYWTMASAKTGNDAAVMESMSAIYRPAALFLTNKENFVATSGDYVGTQINSDNMLWSLSGQVAMIYKVIYGLQYETDGLRIKPFVPQALQGKRTLRNFRYRNAILDFEMEGCGNVIESIELDDQALADAVIPSSIEGKHAIKIKLANKELNGVVAHVPNHTSIVSPNVRIEKTQLIWDAVPGASEYGVLRNGKVVHRTKEMMFELSSDSPAEYQVFAIDEKGYESFASEPLLRASFDNVQLLEMEKFAQVSPLPYKGYSGKGFVEISLEKNTVIHFSATISEAGVYAVDFLYSNGNGPVNTENKCAMRTLICNDKSYGTIVFPQRGSGEWSEWGNSNSVLVTLEKGEAHFILRYEPQNVNMNGEINSAMLDRVRLVRMK